MNKQYLRHSILRICQQPRTFEYISKNIKGLYPNDVIDILNELNNDGLISLIEDMWVIKQIDLSGPPQLFSQEPAHYLQKYMGYYDFLKTPHPLDFEWRNSTASLQKLIAKIQSLLLPKDKILLLGMPTLFAMAIEKDIPFVTCLIERNKPIVSGLQKIIKDEKRFSMIEADLFELNPQTIGRYFCVVMDPPWYTSHFKQFMWVAANCVDLNGLVAISLPPINTKVNVIKERVEWFSFCASLGLCLEILEPEQLVYSMPFFEFNALRAKGIKDVMPFWRRGDLAIFRKIQNANINRPAIEGVNMSWIEREFNDTRFRIKVNEPINDKPLEIESLLKGDILPTVSNNDPLRDNANIWTSGNRIFRVNNPIQFVNCIDEVSRRFPKTNEETNVNKFIEVVSGIEKQEFSDYLEWIYYEMERQIN